MLEDYGELRAWSKWWGFLDIIVTATLLTTDGAAVVAIFSSLLSQPPPPCRSPNYASWSHFANISDRALLCFNTASTK